MEPLVIAVDVDGTLYDGRGVAPEAEAALRTCRHLGHLVVLVTGRRHETLPDVVGSVLPSVHVVVAEEGGVLVDTATGIVELLAEPVDDALVGALRGVPDLDVGRVAIGGPVEFRSTFEAALDMLGLRRRVVVNKNSVSIAPIGCDKASGLRSAVAHLGAHGMPIVAIGDAENDLPMFIVSTYPHAVANADLAVREAGVPMSTAPAGRGVAEILGRYLSP